jgi:protocatechuate 3,4-dioxygenase beta subunit
MQIRRKSQRSSRSRSHVSPPSAALSSSRRVPRREALKGLGALAVTATAFAAVGCSSDGSGASAAGAAGQGGAPTAGNAAAGGAGSTAVGAAGSATAGSAGTRAGVSGTTGTSTAGASAGATGNSTAGSAGSAQAGASGTPSMSTAGASGGVSPAAGSGGAGGTGTTTLDMLQCIVTPAMDEGPFFVEEQQLDRANLVMGETDAAVAMATPLRLVMGIYKVDGMMCMPMSNVQVDIWQANAIGVYSDVASGVVQSVDTRGKTFLRGYQKTDAQGKVAFDTIYPGWYMSRTIHIHFKLRMPGSGSSAYEFTSQMYFDEAINAMVLSKGPYTNRTGTRTVLNEQDHIFNGQPVGSSAPPANGMAPGKQIMPTLVAMGSGYEGTLKIGVKM